MNQAFITVDLGFGDSGKGTIVDFLASQHEAPLVVRYNGGAQCAHSVVLPDGREHIFNQFGSGTFVPGSATFYSKYAYFSPLLLVSEMKRLERKGVVNPGDLFYVDENALVTTPYHRAANRLREIARAGNAHGTCGIGIGETARLNLEVPEIAPRVKDFTKEKLFANVSLAEVRKHFFLEVQQLFPLLDRKDETVRQELSTFDVDPVDVLKMIQSVYDQIHILNADEVGALFAKSETVIFEGAQGVLLDQDHGFHPYTTWSDTTSRNAYAILSDLQSDVVPEEIGIIRAFTTRHGPGPFPSEAKYLSELLEDPRNPENRWQKRMRIGQFDAVALRYALAVNRGVTSLAVTHLDWVTTVGTWKPVTFYDSEILGIVQTLPVFKYPDFRLIEKRTEVLSRISVRSNAPTQDTEEGVLKEITQLLGVNVGIISRGACRSAKRYNK